jgi:NAD+ kinase
VKIPNDDDFVQNITNKFNDSIVFEPNKPLMAYTIRDPIINRIFQNETNRGFANKLVFQSRCFDAVLVIDGGCSYQFNDGAKATLKTLPEDQLRTVVIKES